MKARVILILLILSAAVNVTVAGVAGWRYLGRPGAAGGAGRGDWNAAAPGYGKKLNLTPEEREQFQELRVQLRQQRMELRDQVNAIREDLFEEVRSGTPDTARIDQLIDRISDLQKSFQKSVVKQVVEQRKALSPGQKVIFDKMIEKKFGKNRGMHKKGMGNCFQM